MRKSAAHTTKAHTTKVVESSMVMVILLQERERRENRVEETKTERLVVVPVQTERVTERVAGKDNETDTMVTETVIESVRATDHTDSIEINGLPNTLKTRAPRYVLDRLL